MDTDTALPWQTSNTIMIFVTFLLMVWLFKALNRFKTALHLRRAVINNGVVQIQGLSSYLSYFDGATTNHFHSIVHTRQPKPPSKMNVLYVPYSLQNAKMTINLKEKIIYEFQLFTSIPGKVLFLINYNTGRLRNNIEAKQSLHHQEQPQEGLTYHELLFGLTPTMMTSKIEGIKIHRLPNMIAGKEYAHRDCFVQDCTLGLQTIQFHMPFPKSPNNTSTQGQVFSIALVYLGQHQTSSSSYPTNTTTNSANGGIATATGVSGGRGNGNGVSTGGGGVFGQLHHYLPILSHNNHTNITTNNTNDNEGEGDVENPAILSLTTYPTTHNNTTVVDQPPAITLTVDAVPSIPSHTIATLSIVSFQIPFDILPATTNNTTGTSNTNSIAIGNSANSMSWEWKAILPKELLVQQTDSGRLYSSMEIFGLQSNDNKNNNNNNNTTTNNSNNNNNANNTIVVDTTNATISNSPLRSHHNHNHHNTSTHINNSINSISNSISNSPNVSLRQVHPDLYIDNNTNNTNTNTNSNEDNNHTNTETETEAASPPTSVPTPVVHTNFTLSQGGKYAKEDCVICLTDPQEVILLPCRHLCVCPGCLVYVDKCPVCRSLFEEYIVLGSQDTFKIKIA